MTGSLVLEASAGTGKTYNIERLVIDALQQDPPLSLQDILVVTFTKASTKELKERIRGLLIERIKENPHALHLKKAFCEFDSSAIFTIHGFCKRVLQEEAIATGVPFKAGSDSSPFDKKVLFDLVENVLRTKLSPGLFTPRQLEILLKEHHYKVLELAEALVKALSEGASFDVPYNNDFYWEMIEPLLKELEGQSFSDLKLYFKDSKKWDIALLDTLSHIERSHFEEKAPEILTQLLYFLPSNRMKRAVETELPLADFVNAKLLPQVRAFADYPCQFLRILNLCNEKFQERLKSEGPCTFQSLISELNHLVQKNGEVGKRLKSRYKLILIDEFQDTDPLQWNLFRELFLTKDHRLILVGDPKQSIYGFRGADIYTYLDAVDAMPDGSKRHLSTNYRSSPRLVEALNRFFQFVPEWIPLPRLSSDLPFLPVAAGREAQDEPKPFKCVVARGSEEAFYPFYASEAERLHREKGIPFSEIAFLVRSHVEGQRLLDYFKSCSLPAEASKALSLKESDAFQEMIDLVQAIAKPKDLKRVKRALCGRVFGWQVEALENAFENEAFLQALSFILEGKEMAKVQGVASVLHGWLMKARSRLFQQEDGEIYYQQALEILNWALNKPHLSPEKFLKELVEASENEEEFEPGASRGGIQILTLHSSKGLEFSAVFLPGLCSENKVDNGLVRLKCPSGRRLAPLYPDQEEYNLYLEEEDAEKSRLLYVAMTRARDYLYLPVLLGKGKASLGKASPLHLFMARCQDPSASWKDLYSLIEKGDYPSFFEKVVSDPCMDTIEIDPMERPYFQLLKEAPLLQMPPQVDLSFPYLQQYSFSSLAKVSKEVKKSVPETELPAGQETGLLLHELLEIVPWRLVQEVQSPEELDPFVDKHVKGVAFSAHKKQIARILFDAFNTPLAPHSFCLREVPEEALFREMEFYYDASLAKGVPSLSQAEGMVRGVVDLFFCHKGLYFIVDWKSNWLSSYDRAALNAEMKAHDYFLQEKIYRQALKRYVELIGGDEEHFGGSYYFFLRGLQDGQGLYYIEEDID